MSQYSLNRVKEGLKGLSFLCLSVFSSLTIGLCAVGRAEYLWSLSGVWGEGKHTFSQTYT